jgi:hypothetical protein
VLDLARPLASKLAASLPSACRAKTSGAGLISFLVPDVRSSPIAVPGEEERAYLYAHWPALSAAKTHPVCSLRMPRVISARKKGRLRCHKRPKSREETPKEGSDSGWGSGGRYRIPYVR